MPRTPFADATGILAKCDVAPVVQAVLDTPVVAVQSQKLCRPGHLARQARDPVDHLEFYLRTDPSLTPNLEHLKATFPIRSKVVGQQSRRRQSPFLDPAMPLVDLGKLLETLTSLQALEGGKSPRGAR